jgi:hypothetical protein
MWRSGSGTVVLVDNSFSAVYGPSQQGHRLEGQANILIVGL